MSSPIVEALHASSLLVDGDGVCIGRQLRVAASENLSTGLDALQIQVASEAVLRFRFLKELVEVELHARQCPSYPCSC